MTELNNEIRELNIDELETISGGRGNKSGGPFDGSHGSGGYPQGDLSHAIAVWNTCMTIARGQ